MFTCALKYASNAIITYNVISINLIYGLHAVDLIEKDAARSDSEIKNGHESDTYHLELKGEIKDDDVSKTNEQDSDYEVKSLLEEKYRFRNDEASTRFKVAREDRVYPVFPENHEDRNIAWAFRSYAVRRIIGGLETSINMYPYNVAISRSGNHWCGGSIIDEQWVLTAGHCLESAFHENVKALHPFIIRAGSSFHNRGGYQAKINKVFFPEEYVPGNADFDYCLLRLDRPMPIGRNIAVLNLPSKDYVIKDHDILIVTGWGSTDESGFGHIPDRLRFVPVPVMKKEECQKSYRFYITQRMLCAGYATGGKDACNHDSGGPAVRDGVLIGVVSFGGTRCGDPRSPGVYSRVAEITDWVEATVTNNEANTVAELRANIQKARQRDVDFKRFKARVEDKKNKIKYLLRETLKSPKFIELAKKKLGLIGFGARRSNMYKVTNTSTIEDQTLEEINISNFINEQIINGENEKVNETEKLLNVLALNEAVHNKNSGEFPSLPTLEDDLSIETFIQ